MTGRFHDRAAIAAELARYRQFEECLLVEIRILTPGMDLELVFDYIWDDDCPAGRRVLDRLRRVRLVLEGLGEIWFNAAVPPGLVSDPRRADWGLSEVAHVRLASAPDVSRGNSACLDGPPHRLVVAWETPRRLEATFTHVGVQETLHDEVGA